MGQTYSQEEHVYQFLSHNLLKAIIATRLLGKAYTSDRFHDLLTHAAHLLCSDYEEDLTLEKRLMWVKCMWQTSNIRRIRRTCNLSQS